MQDGSAIQLRNMRDEFLDGTRVSYTQHRLDLYQRDFISRVGDRLVQQTERIAHPSCCCPANQLTRGALYSHLLLPGNLLNVLDHLPRRTAFAVEALAAREHSKRHVLHS